MGKNALQFISDDSVEPKCAHFGTCGGCRAQHISYQSQLHQKQNFIKTLFNYEPLPIIGADPSWGYRNKMEFSFSESRDGKQFLGLIQKGSRGKVVQLEECYLTSSWFVESLKRVYTWWQKTPLHAFRPMANTGQLRTLTLREGYYTGQKMAVLTISGSEWETVSPYLDEFASAFEEIDSLIARLQIVQKKVPTRFEEILLRGHPFILESLHDEKGNKRTFKIRASSFFQPNTRQAERLLQEAVKHVEGEVIFDLYCGTGSIGIFAAEKAKKVIGIEIVTDSIQDAKENLQENGITNMEVYLGDVEKILMTLPERADTVIVDPPRAGLSEKTLSILKELKPKRVIYISCNPVTQAQNCLSLGYKILSLQPVDQFPHTPHLENIAILVPE